MCQQFQIQLNNRVYMNTIVLHQGKDEDALEMTIEVTDEEFEMMEQIRRFSHDNWEGQEFDLLKEAKRRLKESAKTQTVATVLKNAVVDNETINPNKNDKRYPILIAIVGVIGLITLIGIWKYSSNNPKPNPDWTSYSFPNVFSISIPPTMKMRNDLSITGKMINAFHDSQVFQMMCDECDIFYEKSQIVFQPLGMNSNNRQIVAEATATYARILFDFGYNDGVSQRDISRMTHSDFMEYDEIVGKRYQTEYECMNNFLNNEAKLIWYPSKKLKINGKYCIAIEYDRTGLEGLVKVKKYIFLYDGKEIDVTMSYRESEKNKYADDFEGVINSFKIID